MSERSDTAERTEQPDGGQQTGDTGTSTEQSDTSDGIRTLSRRSVLGTLGAVGAGSLLGSADALASNSTEQLELLPDETGDITNLKDKSIATFLHKTGRTHLPQEEVIATDSPVNNGYSDWLHEAHYVQTIDIERHDAADVDSDKIHGSYFWIFIDSTMLTQQTDIKGVIEPAESAKIPGDKDNTGVPEPINVSGIKEAPLTIPTQDIHAFSFSIETDSPLEIEDYRLTLKRNWGRWEYGGWNMINPDYIGEEKSLSHFYMNEAGLENRIINGITSRNETAGEYTSGALEAYSQIQAWAEQYDKLPDDVQKRIPGKAGPRVGKLVKALKTSCGWPCYAFKIADASIQWMSQCNVESGKTVGDNELSFDYNACNAGGMGYEVAIRAYLPEGEANLNVKTEYDVKSWPNKNHPSALENTVTLEDTSDAPGVSPPEDLDPVAQINAVKRPVVDGEIKLSANESYDPRSALGTGEQIDWSQTKWIVEGFEKPSNQRVYRKEGSGTVFTDDDIPAGDHFVATLIVENNEGRTDKETLGMEPLDPEPPEPDFTVEPSNPDQADTITLDAGETDSGPDNKFFALDFEWQVTYPSGTEKTLDGSRTTFEPDRSGEYEIRLLVWDQYGVHLETANKTFTVDQSEGPIPKISIDRNGSLPTQRITVDGRQTDTGDWNQHELSYMITVEKPSGEQKTFDGQNMASFVPAEPGTAFVQLIVTDGNNQDHIKARTVTVNEPDPPQASFTYSPNSPSRNATVDLDASPSSRGESVGSLGYDWQVLGMDPETEPDDEKVTSFDLDDDFNGSQIAVSLDVTQSLSESGPAVYKTTKSISKKITISGDSEVKIDESEPPSQMDVGVEYEADADVTGDDSSFQWRSDASKYVEFGDKEAKNTTVKVKEKYGKPDTVTITAETDADTDTVTAEVKDPGPEVNIVECPDKMELATWYDVSAELKPDDQGFRNWEIDNSNVDAIWTFGGDRPGDRVMITGRGHIPDDNTITIRASGADDVAEKTVELTQNDKPEPPKSLGIESPYKIQQGDNPVFTARIKADADRNIKFEWRLDGRKAGTDPGEDPGDEFPPIPTDDSDDERKGDSDDERKGDSDDKRKGDSDDKRKGDSDSYPDPPDQPFPRPGQRLDKHQFYDVDFGGHTVSVKAIDGYGQAVEMKQYFYADMDYPY